MSPPGTQACCFDIKSFHRTCPVLPDHKPFLVVTFEEKLYINHNHPFGAQPASSNAGQIANALVDIWSAQLADDGLLFKFEDDINCFRFPNTLGPFRHNNFLYAHDRNSVLDLVSCLNVPWHAEKSGIEFKDCFSFIGFIWDLPRKRVSLPDKKRLKYLLHVNSMLESHENEHGSFKLRDIQVLHGTLIHISFVFPEGSSRLPIFSNFMSSYHGNKFAKRHLTNSFIHSLKWWQARLQDTSAFRQLFPIQPLDDFGIYVDASTSWGIGVILDHSYYTLTLKSDWKHPGQDICWLEAIAIEILFCFLRQLGFRNRQRLSSLFRSFVLILISQENSCTF